MKSWGPGRALPAEPGCSLCSRLASGASGARPPPRTGSMAGGRYAVRLRASLVLPLARAPTLSAGSRLAPARADQLTRDRMPGCTRLSPRQKRPQLIS